MKTIATFFRAGLLLLLTVMLGTGCKIWDPRTWGKKPRNRTVQRWQYEAATPYAGLGSRPAPSDGLIAVSGMGYDGSVAFFTPDGRRVVSESTPAGAMGPAGTAAAGGGLSEWDSRIKRERFGDSFAELRLRSGEGDAGMAVKEEPPPDPFAGLPVGVAVPGKPGFVNLPDPHAGLPEVDVRGIASGTPVEVPHPLKPGEKIRFRVP